MLQQAIYKQRFSKPKTLRRLQNERGNMTKTLDAFLDYIDELLDRKPMQVSTVALYVIFVCTAFIIGALPYFQELFK